MIYTEDFFSSGNSYPNDDLVQLIDSFTNENVNYKLTTTWHDGSVMDDTKVDGIMYRKKDTFFYKRIYDEKINVLWFGLNNTGTVDNIPLANKLKGFVDKLKGNCTLYFPEGHYRFTDQLKFSNVTNFSITGSSKQYLFFKGDKVNASCVLDFDESDNGGLVIETFTGLSISNLFISYNQENKQNASGAALKITQGHIFEIEGLAVDAYAAQSSPVVGMEIGGNTMQTCCFSGSISDCKIAGNDGYGLWLRNANTSINVTSIYCLHTPIVVDGTVYSTLSNCAVDGGTIGYYITGSTSFNTTNVSFLSCGAESQMKTAFLIDNFSQNITFLNPYTAKPNTTRDANVGGLMTIWAHTMDGYNFVKNITVISPTCHHNSGEFDVMVFGNIDNVQFQNTNKKIMQKGFGGPSVQRLEITGDYAERSFTFTHNNCLNFDQATFKTSFYRNNDRIYFRIKATPASSFDIQTITMDSTIELPFKGNGKATLSNHIFDKGSCLIDNGTIYLLNSDLTDMPIYIDGFVMFNDKKILGMDWPWS